MVEGLRVEPGRTPGSVEITADANVAREITDALADFADRPEVNNVRAQWLLDVVNVIKRARDGIESGY